MKKALMVVLLSAVAVILSVNTGFAQLLYDQYFSAVRVDSASYTGGAINVSAQGKVVNNVFQPGNITIFTTGSALVTGALVYFSTTANLNIGSLTANRNSANVNGLTSGYTVDIHASYAWFTSAGTTIGDVVSNENSLFVKDFTPDNSAIVASRFGADVKSVGSITFNSNSVETNGTGDIGSIEAASIYANVLSTIGNITANSNSAKIYDAYNTNYVAAVAMGAYASTIGNIVSNFNSVEVSSSHDINNLAAGNSIYAESSLIGSIVSNSNSLKLKDVNYVNGWVYGTKMDIYANSLNGNVTANSNKVEINGVGWIDRIYGAWVFVDASNPSSSTVITANSNEVSVSGLGGANQTVAASVRANNAKIIADNNKITIRESFASYARTVSVKSLSKENESIQANNNSLLISNSILYGNTSIAVDLNGEARNVNLNNNSLLIQNSLWIGYACGVDVGWVRFNGKANNNSVTIKNASAYGSNIYGVSMSGGEWDLGDYKYGGFEANNNSVRIENIILGTSLGNVYGAYLNVQADKGTTNKNSVYMLNANSYGRVYGGHNFADDDRITAEQYANENSVTLINSWADYVYGGYSRSNWTALNYSTSTGWTYGTGNTLNFANNNTVSIIGGAVNNAVCGGAARSQTSNAQANNNSVMIENVLNLGRVGGGSAYGAFLAEHSNGSVTANGNFVSIKGARNGLGAAGAEVVLNSAESAGSVTASSNKLEIYNSGLFYEVYGAKFGIYASTSSLFNINLNNNEVSIGSSYGIVYVHGSNLFFSGVANAFSNNNKVTISDSISNYIYGAIVNNYSGYAASGKFGNSQANNNSVKISGSYVEDIYGVQVDGDRIVATGNSVSITDSMSFESIYGAYGNAYLSGTLNRNSVSIKNTNGYEGKSIAGACLDTPYSSDNLFTGKYVSAGHGVFEASENSVYIENVKGWIDVYGASAWVYAGIEKANKNSVYILNSMVDEVYGADVRGHDSDSLVTGMYANENSVTLINSMANQDIYGGYSYSYRVRASTASAWNANDGKAVNFANGNTVYVKGGIIAGVYGGYAYSLTSNAQASNNTVVIENVARAYHIYGGDASGNFDSEKVQAINNTVTIIGGLTVDGHICGGRASNSGSGGVDRMTGNTLTVKGGHIMANGIRGFEKYNLYVANLDTPVIFSANGGGYGNTINLSASTVNLFLEKGVKVAIGDKIDLIRSGYGCGVTASSNSQATARGGVSKLYIFDISVDNSGDILQASLKSSENNKDAKALSEGVAAGAILAVQGADILNIGLLSGLQEGKIEVAGSFFGGSSKYDTGSSVELNSIGAAAGIAKRFGAFSAGIFAEYANADFDTEYSAIKSNGKADYIGGGILARKDIKENFYAEGLVRCGQVKNDYKTKLADVMGTTADFDYSSIYFGVSLGAGRIFAANEKIDIDLSAKYALTSVGGGEAELKTGDKYEFDSVLSNRLQIGAKGEYKASEAIKPYLALSLDYEISGDVTAKIEGDDVEAPTFNGATFSAGVGASAKLTEKLTLDLGAQLYAGVREGFMGLLKAKYQF